MREWREYSRPSRHHHPVIVLRQVLPVRFGDAIVHHFRRREAGITFVSLLTAMATCAESSAAPSHVCDFCFASQLHAGQLLKVLHDGRDIGT